MRLAPVRWHGAWGGATRSARRPRQRVERQARRRRSRSSRRAGDPAAARLLRRFHRAVYRAARRRALPARPACSPSVAIGEWPVAAPGDVLALARRSTTRQAYAYRDAGAPRGRASARGASDWYAEELFARFAPYALGGDVGRARPARRLTARAHRGDGRRRA